MKKIAIIMRYLKSEYKQTFFNRTSDPFHVLISTVISQRTRDENTERISKELFRIYKTPEQLAAAPIKRIEMIIRGSGFYHVKAKRIKKIAGDVIKRFDGKVPEEREKLLELEGVGPKTAGCVLVYGFKKPAIPVDTHVHRISNRLGLVDTKTPEESEIKLMDVIPKKNWIEINELMVKFGQNKCYPIRPMCSECHLKSVCGYYKKNKGTKKIR